MTLLSPSQKMCVISVAKWFCHGGVTMAKCLYIFDHVFRREGGREGRGGEGRGGAK